MEQESREWSSSQRVEQRSKGGPAVRGWSSSQRVAVRRWSSSQRVRQTEGVQRAEGVAVRGWSNGQRVEQWSEGRAAVRG